MTPLIQYKYPFFKPEVNSLERRIEELTNFSQQTREAGHILVVGGRSVAIEIVGEILNSYPNKEITIVHPMNTLMDSWPKSGLKKLDKFLANKKKGRNVNIVLGKKFVRTLDDNRHELSDGSFIQGILLFNLFYLLLLLYSFACLFLC